MGRPHKHRLFPSYEQVEEALLLLLVEQGGELSGLWASDTYEPLADVFRLDGYARSVTRAKYLNDGRDEPYWHTWVQFARDRLVKKGYLHRHIEHASPGCWMLTANGKDRAERIAARRAKPLFDGYGIVPVSALALKPISEITPEDLFGDA